MTRTVLLIDDNTAFRVSTAWLLGGLGYEAREFASAHALLAQVDAIAATPHACCVLTDVRMPGTDGMRLHDALIARGSTWPVIYMTGHGDVPLAVAAMQKGACSFLEKPFREAALEEALEDAFARATATSGASAASAVSHVSRGPITPERFAALEPGPRSSLADGLTKREREVLDLVVQGLLNKTIADRLGISIKTVELHRSNMMHKIGARSITDLMRRVLTDAGGAP
jgi:two-component system response regulator FixJ